MEAQDVHGWFTTVVIDAYGDHTLNLPNAAEHAELIADVLHERGFMENPRIGSTATHDVHNWLNGWKPVGPRMLLYWTGHAQASVDDIALFCGDYEPSKPANKVTGRLLAEVLAQQAAIQIVVILDTCKAGIGVDSITETFRRHVKSRSYPVGREPQLAVLSSAGNQEFARDGVFAEAMAHVLRHGPPASTATYNSWTQHDILITPYELFDAIRQRLHDIDAHQQPDFNQAISVPGFFPFLPNRRHNPYRPDAIVETLRQRAFAESDLLEHFLIKFRGIDTLTADGWHYSPRPEPQARITRWLLDGDGILIVTGPPGSGKSALLGWLAAISMPEYRGHVAAMLSDGGIKLPPRCGGRRYSRQATHPAGMRELSRRRAQPASTGQRMAGARSAGQRYRSPPLQKGRKVTILLDALDEAYAADQTRIARDLLVALAALEGVRVIVGTRPNREDHADPTHATPDGAWSSDGPLIRALTTTEDRILRLDTDPGAAHAITTYVSHRLLDSTTNSPYRGRSDLAESVAEVIAKKSDGIFLFARLVTRALIRRSTVLTPSDPEANAVFNGGVAEAFDADLTSYGTDRNRVHDLLKPLAWAQGAGLPRRDIWLTIANAIAPVGARYHGDDLAWVLEYAGAHIIESGEDGQTVYRLYHQAFNDYFQHGIDPIQVQTAITDALITLVEAVPNQARDWAHANAYLHRHLTTHATAAGTLAELLTDTRLWLYTDIDRLARALVSTKLLNTPSTRLLRRALDTLRAAHTAAERATILAEFGLRDEPQSLRDLTTRPELDWEPCWTTAQPTSFHRTFPEHSGQMNSVAFAHRPGKTALLVGGSSEGYLRVWDAETGEPIGAPIETAVGPVWSIATVTCSEHSVLVASGSSDGIVAVWNALTGELEGAILEHSDSVFSVAMTTRSDGSPILASGSIDGTVTMWDVISGEQLKQTISAHNEPVYSVALGTRAADSMVLASGAEDGTIRLWDVQSLEPLGQPLVGHTEAVLAVAFGTTADGQFILASSSADQTARLWDVQSGGLSAHHWRATQAR